MTDEEYDALDELLTKTTPHLTKVTGPLTRQRQLPNALEDIPRIKLKRVNELHE